MQFNYLESWTSVFQILMFWMRDEAEGWVKQGRGGMVCVCVCEGGVVSGAISQDKLWDPGWNREKTPADTLLFSHRGVFWCPDVSVNGFDSAVSQRHCCCCCCCKVPEHWNSINTFIQGWAAACLFSTINLIFTKGSSLTRSLIVFIHRMIWNVAVKSRAAVIS